MSASKKAKEYGFKSLKEVAVIERQPLMDGRRMAMILSPAVIQKARAKEEVKKV